MYLLHILQLLGNPGRTDYIQKGDCTLVIDPPRAVNVVACQNLGKQAFKNIKFGKKKALTNLVHCNMSMILSNSPSILLP